MISIAIINLKGGVGKSVTACNLAAELAAKRKSVLVVDLDKQGNTSKFFGWLDYDRLSVAEVLLAVAIIMGIWVRMSALILSLGILLMFAWGGFGAGELEFVWLGVYVFLIISGGGLYAFDTALTPAKPKK